MKQEAGKKNIVILGAGFAGLRVAQQLSKKLKTDSYSIILIDRRYVHIYTPDLYEIAAAFNEKITNECLTQLTDAVATPIKTLIDKDKVNFIQDEIKDIDPKDKKVKLQKHGEISYKYLVVALGSEINYFGIPGLEKHSFSVKTITDALKLNCHLDMFFQEKWEKKNSADEVNIIIGGGGATGVEVAGELVKYMDKLSRKYHYQRDKIHIRLIEGSTALVGLDQGTTKDMLDRFKDLGVKVNLGLRISGVDEKKIHTDNCESKKESFAYDVLIWTGGVQVNKLIRDTLGEEDKRGAIPVGIYLRSVKYDDIFAAGDNAFFSEPGKEERVPMLAQIAFEQGKIIAHNLLLAVKRKGRGWKSFKVKREAIIVPIGGKFAVCKIAGFTGSGLWCWFLRRLVTLKYAISILPFCAAFKKWLQSGRVFVKND